jgi:hypothetical protein
MGLALKQVGDGERSRQGCGNLVGGSKRGADIAASIPGYLWVVFQVQKKPFFHLTTEGLPGRPGLSRFPTGNPSRDALSGNFEQVNATHSSFRHEVPSRICGAQSASGEFPPLKEQYTRRTSSCRVSYRVVFEP